MTAIKSIDVDLWRTLVEYNPELGFFKWKNPTGKAKARANLGLQAGYLNNLGYRVLEHKGVSVLGHRLAWALMCGDTTLEIDHKNLNPSDNRFSNLRAAEVAENRANTRKRSHNRSGFKGVHDTQSGPTPYRTQISINGKTHYLGNFATGEEAHQAYCTAANDTHGEFANSGAAA